MTELPKRYPECCKKGHKLSDDLVYTPKNGPSKWRCRVCLRASYKRHYEAKCERRKAEGWVPNASRVVPPKKTICRGGHPWLPETTYVSPTTTHRQCRICRKLRLDRLAAERKIRRAAEKAARKARAKAVIDELTTPVEVSSAGDLPA